MKGKNRDTSHFLRHFPICLCRKIRMCPYFLALAFLAGCASAPHIIKYEIEPPEEKIEKDIGIAVLAFTDKRPSEEKEGLKGKLLIFSTRDKNFAQPPAIMIPQHLTKELVAWGLRAEDVSTREEAGTADYRVEGELLHFQAVIKLNKATFIPYLGNITTLWAKDEFVITLSMRVKLFLKNSDEPIFDEEFDVSEDLKLPTGLLNLARYKRGLRHKLKVLDLATGEVLAKVRERIIQETRKFPSAARLSVPARLTALSFLLAHPSDTVPARR